MSLRSFGRCSLECFGRARGDSGVGIAMGTATATFGTSGRTAPTRRGSRAASGHPERLHPLAGPRRRTPRAGSGWLVSDPCPTSLSETGGSTRAKAIKLRSMCITAARKRSSASMANSKSKSMGYARKLIRGRSSWFLVEPFTPSPLGKERTPGRDEPRDRRTHRQAP
jgi:hypothetical protein